MKEVKLNCMVCGGEFMGPEPLMCCSGRDCGCMGMPVDPIVCSENCCHRLNIGLYCKYLIDEYGKIMTGDGGGVMRDLMQFYTEGRIKDLIDDDTSYESKVNFINGYKDKILYFAKHKGLDLDLISFE